MTWQELIEKNFRLVTTNFCWEFTARWACVCWPSTHTSLSPPPARSTTRPAWRRPPPPPRGATSTSRRTCAAWRTETTTWSSASRSSPPRRTCASASTTRSGLTGPSPSRQAGKKEVKPRGLLDIFHRKSMELEICTKKKLRREWQTNLITQPNKESFKTKIIFSLSMNTIGELKMFTRKQH